MKFFDKFREYAEKGRVATLDWGGIVVLFIGLVLAGVIVIPLMAPFALLGWLIEDSPAANEPGSKQD